LDFSSQGKNMNKRLLNLILNLVSFSLISILLAACSITINTGTKPTPSQFVMPTAINASAGQPIQQPVQPQNPPVVNPTLAGNAPGGPYAMEGQVEDADSSKHASEKRVLSGDSYQANFFERAFTANVMDYLPDVDILNGFISTDAQYLYFIIELAGTNRTSGGMIASYGVELDTDKDGRGNYSVWALNPVGTNWTIDNVTILKDGNRTVGGKDPNIADGNIYFGDGYETTIPNNGPEQVWVRISPTSTATVQIAVPRSIIDNPGEFLWGVWADNGPKNPNLFDYDDHFTYKDAGSPISANQYYPLKQVPAIDNTCRRPYGFNPGYRIPNMCWSGTPAKQTPTCVCMRWNNTLFPPVCTLWKCI
jgi:hypothetical protein